MTASSDFDSSNSVGDTPEPDPDQAWKALGLVNDWIRHADAKVGASLAASGVVGAILFNLVKDLKAVSGIVLVLVVVCCVTILVGGISASIALMPRVRARWWRREEPTSMIFFDHISRAHKNDAPSYVEVLGSLTSRKVDLTKHIAQQVHSNAAVAQRKYRWANLSLLALTVAMLSLAGVALVTALNWGR